MDFAKYLRDSRQTIKQANKTKNKVQALKLLDQHEEKWEEYTAEILTEIIINKNMELDEVHSELSYCWYKIKESMTIEELERYGDTLPDEILDNNWTKQQREQIDLIFAAICPKPEQCYKSEKSQNEFIKCIINTFSKIFQSFVFLCNGRKYLSPMPPS